MSRSGWVWIRTGVVLVVSVGLLSSCVTLAYRIYGGAGPGAFSATRGDTNSASGLERSSQLKKSALHLKGDAVSAYDAALAIDDAVWQADRPRLEAVLDKAAIAEAWYQSAYADPRTAEEYAFRASRDGQGVALATHNADWLRIRAGFVRATDDFLIPRAHPTITFAWDLSPQSNSQRGGSLIMGVEALHGTIRRVRVDSATATIDVERPGRKPHWYRMRKGAQGAWRVVAIDFLGDEDLITHLK